MNNNKVNLFEDRGSENQRSTQTKSSHSIDLIKKEDANNSICKIKEQLLSYIAVNDIALNCKRKIVNPLLQQIKSGVDVIVITTSFFKHNTQLWTWIKKNYSCKVTEICIRFALEELFGIILSSQKIKVIKS